MKNRKSIFYCLVLYVTTGFSQNSQLTIEGSNGKFYLDHTVVAKENWYSIGRLFNLPPHDIASYNNVSFDKPLDIGQQIHIPLTASNFDQKQLKTIGETLVPVYHLVQEKEWIFKVSSIYNDVPVASLEKWNKIKRDDVKPGVNLIVGFLKVKTDLSPLAVGISSNPAIAGNAADISNYPLKNTDQTNTQTNNKPATNNPAKPVTQTVSAPVSNNVNVIPVSNNAERVNNYAATHSNGGFFSIDYSGSGKSASGQAGTFKSTSGWNDGKYYALMNGQGVGTIIKVTGMNGKTIYAKVLGQLPDMKESSGLLIRISNAASAELGLGEGRFPVDVRY